MVGITCSECSRDVLVRHVRSTLVDISALTGTIVIAEAYDPNREQAVIGARLIYEQTANNTAGAVVVGTVDSDGTTDNDSIVASTATSNSKTAPGVTELTLATTLKTGAQQNHEGARIKKGTFITVGVTAGASNAGDFYVELDIVNIDAGKPW